MFFCLQADIDFEEENLKPVILQGLKKAVSMLEPEYHKEILSGKTVKFEAYCE